MLMFGMLLGVSLTLASLTIEHGKPLHDAIWRLLFIVFGIFAVAMPFFTHFDVGVVSMSVNVVCSLVLARLISVRIGRRTIARKMEQLREYSERALDNFERLDVDGDGLISVYDVARFSASPNLRDSDIELARWLAHCSHQVGHKVVESTHEDVALTPPSLVSRDDLSTYPNRQAELWRGWL